MIYKGQTKIPHIKLYGFEQPQYQTCLLYADSLYNTREILLLTHN